MPKVVLLTIDSSIGRMAASYLAERFHQNFTVVIEQRFPRTSLLWRRTRRLGLLRVIGQVGFIALQWIQISLSRSRIASVRDLAKLQDRWPASAEIVHVASVNDPACVAILRKISPDVILVVGTRLIHADVLANVGKPFINYHAGITPKYRGAHGAYWALAEKDLANCGVTVHIVDKGIDTGDVLYQDRIIPNPGDNFSIYPVRQLSAALPLLERAANDAIAGTIKPRKIDLPSRLWSHPTLWTYLSNGFLLGIW